ncbi:MULTISPECIES: LacI family DNA-binding transcriptional regulator [Neobacillus]|jgi:LacI family transcriptional regulator|uniref:LacI family transcriptional regulator n=1 Tax=Neobacillus sedimentimangrovi TaxID=2699460 RepID=A0ABS8QHK6_9BACI|nr:LacI family DNA-binding transcriptional regulator [Neobacillus sedimentimangrovi]AIM15720.1 LacI family transcriptional regulator [Bacillus sp. X1(2014)]MCD4838665.1 LacI family transcriptional regulator [Neobacillus sedimentimangrovi]
MATIRDVARKAGVSVATVSRALNDKGYVHEDTRKAINEAIKELNYKPNEVARSLYKKKSRLIGLLLPDIRNPFFPELARGVEDIMQESGYRLIIGNADEKPEKENDYIQTFIQNNVIGIISASHTEKKHYKHLTCPVVFLDRTSEPFPSVYADGLTGGKMAAREIIRRGSKRITLLRGPIEVKTAQDRFKGALDELCQANVDFNVMTMASFAYQDASKCAKEIFEKYPDTDGVIASNDIAAAAILHEAIRKGKSIPNDLQIVGYDDIPLSGLLFPPLSTIKQPAYEMGREAAKLLIKLINNEPIQNRMIQMPVTFIERQTTRKVEENG